MNVIISNSSDKPIYEQVYLQIKTEILGGLLRPGEQLPSIRMLAKDLRISVITTKRSYDLLEEDGLIETTPGKGTYVSSKNKELLKEEVLQKFEEELSTMIQVARFQGITLDEFQELVTLLYKEDIYGK